MINGETFEVLLKAYDYAKCTGGAFDVTVGPLVMLWNVLNRTYAPPSESEIKSVLPAVGYAGLILNGRIKSAALERTGQSVDLGGIGKGYAADKVIGIFKKFGVTSAYTNYGGNVATIGTKPDGSPWHVGIQHPRQTDGLIGVISVAGKSVVTSGDYQRCFMARDGKRYHHIIDPRTGYPAENGLIGVTVVADSSTKADALSTAVFVLGLEKGLQILKAFPGTEAILISADMSVSLTEGLKECFFTTEDITINTIKTKEET
jgi:thiamine biosynthesis lipoprotein